VKDRWIKNIENFDPNFGEEGFFEGQPKDDHVHHGFNDPENPYRPNDGFKK